MCGSDHFFSARSSGADPGEEAQAQYLEGGRRKVIINLYIISIFP